jgi:hypothetical protein
MKPRYVVDTNVLIAASAADPVHPTDIDATPEDPALRLKVWNWLRDFGSGPTRIVLDMAGKIQKEYRNKLDYNDFGLQVVIRKSDTNAVDYVEIAYDSNDDGCIPEELEPYVHDRADRKMVAAALESLSLFGEGCIAFAGESDWHECEDELIEFGLILEPIIEEWSRKKFEEKQK